MRLRRGQPVRTIHISDFPGCYGSIERIEVDDARPILFVNLYRPSTGESLPEVELAWWEVEPIPDTERANVMLLFFQMEAEQLGKVA